MELVVGIRGVERRGGCARGDTEEGRRHLRAVGQHDRHSLTAAQPEAVECPDYFVHVGAERVERQRPPPGRRQGHCLGGAPLEESEDRAALGHRGAPIGWSGHAAGAGPEAASVRHVRRRPRADGTSAGARPRQD